MPSGVQFFPRVSGHGKTHSIFSNDWQEVRVKVSLNRRTRNYAGTIYRESIYGAVDPIYMMMFIKILGHKYIVWDKTVSISFKKPGMHTVFATCVVSDEDIQAI